MPGKIKEKWSVLHIYALHTAKNNNNNFVLEISCNETIYENRKAMPWSRVPLNANAHRNGFLNAILPYPYDSFSFILEKITSRVMIGKRAGHCSLLYKIKICEI